MSYVSGDLRTRMNPASGKTTQVCAAPQHEAFIDCQG
jgi:hypothetical protein